jgi:hypothetical protein
LQPARRSAIGGHFTRPCHDALWPRRCKSRRRSKRPGKGLLLAYLPQLDR